MDKQQIIYSIGYEIQQIDNAYAAYAGKTDVSYLTLTVLRLISDMNGTCTQKDISDNCDASKQSVNAVISSLLKKEYIILTEQTSDRRKKCISLTEKGKTYADSILGPLEQIEENAAADLPLSDMETALDTLRKFSALLQRQVKEF